MQQVREILNKLCLNYLHSISSYALVGQDNFASQLINCFQPLQKLRALWDPVKLVNLVFIVIDRSKTLCLFFSDGYTLLLLFTSKRELNYLRINYGFEKIKVFRYLNFK